MKPFNFEETYTTASNAVFHGGITNHSGFEGPLSPTLEYILSEVKSELATIDTALIDKGLILDLIESVADKLGLVLISPEIERLKTYLLQEQTTFGILSDLVQDSSINDIIVSNFKTISVQKGRKNYRLNRAFSSSESYESFVEKLLLAAGISYSTKSPICDGMIGNSIRVHAVHRSLCESGPYLTLRINRFESITLEKLAQFGLATSHVLEYLQDLVGSEKTVLIAGEVGTGKTTLVRALSSTIPKDDSILVIEDTPEIYLTHPHVRYIRTRIANLEGEGEVSPSQCIRAGMRMAMNRIVFGEIRDAEAAESFVDVCSSGHSGISTIHSRTASESLSRLKLFLGRVQKGVGGDVLEKQIASSVHTVVYVGVCNTSGFRRILEVREVGSIQERALTSKVVFKYNYNSGKPIWS